MTSPFANQANERPAERYGSFQRLNRGGDRQANNAIHTIAIIRAKHQPETRAYLDRRIREGKTKREALRSLKRHISRELYQRLNAIPLTS